MRSCKSFSSKLTAILLTCVLTLLYNEYLVYHIVLRQCGWPQTHPDALRVMVLSDTHLLGVTGHWWDRLRREWQMERAFQTSLHLHEPDIVFILGDLFDDGKWSPDKEFGNDVQRYYKMFRHAEHVRLIPVVGNHDIGFHYMANEQKLERFIRATNATSTLQLISLRNVTFVTANSVAFEGDGCFMCSSAERELKSINKTLSCSKGRYVDAQCSTEPEVPYSRPILLQHYPLYRESDSTCTGPDAAPIEDRTAKFRIRFDCLSPQASLQLMSSLNPRLVISGHTHHHCVHVHDNGVPEWSVPSFSWRNKKGPSFLMVSVSSIDYTISKCWMPDENTVYNVYGLIITLSAIYIMFSMAISIYKSILTKRAKYS